MPLKIEVEFDDPQSRSLLAEMRAQLGRTDELHEAMAERVQERVVEHIRTTKQSPNTGWWARVADSVTRTHDATSAMVSVPEAGAALRLYGGTVRQKPGGPLLTIPTEHVPVSNRMRTPARQMGLMAFLPSRRAYGPMRRAGDSRDDVAGVLVEGERTGRFVKSGKRQGQPVAKPKAGGRVLFILMRQARHDPDPTVLPTDEELAETARKAAFDFVAPDLN